MGINKISNLETPLKKVVLIYGPTAVRKTKLALELAKQFSGEIISADSMQIYRGMDIGTAKICKKEQNQLKHHLIDIVNVNEYFSVAEFQKKAQSSIDDISNRGKVSIVVGGSALYFKVLMEGLLQYLPKDSHYRSDLEKLSKEKGNDFLYQQLSQIDPESAASIHKNDKKRIIRALEIYHVSCKKRSNHIKYQKKHRAKYDFLKLGLTMERELLYNVINMRCEKMIQEGLIEEVEGFQKKGCTRSMQSMQGIGYRQILGYLEKEYTYEEALFLFKRDSRRLAKRQKTYFSSFQGTHWYQADEPESENKKIQEKLKCFLSNNHFNNNNHS